MMFGITSGLLIGIIVVLIIVIVITVLYMRGSIFGPKIFRYEIDNDYSIGDTKELLRMLYDIKKKPKGNVIIQIKFDKDMITSQLHTNDIDRAIVEVRKIMGKMIAKGGGPFTNEDMIVMGRKSMQYPTNINQQKR